MLTNTGEVHVLGDNTFGQHGVEDLKENKSKQKKDAYYGIY